MKKQVYAPYMLRPIIYITAFRLMVAAIILLLLTRFVPNGPTAGMVSGFLAMGFALLAYLVCLRTDGLRIPRVKYIRPKKKTDPLRSIGGMGEHIDDDAPVPFEELEDDEKDFCSLLANLAGILVFTICSFVL